MHNRKKKKLERLQKTKQSVQSASTELTAAPLEEVQAESKRENPTQQMVDRIFSHSFLITVENQAEVYSFLGKLCSDTPEWAAQVFRLNLRENYQFELHEFFIKREIHKRYVYDEVNGASSLFYALLHNLPLSVIKELFHKPTDYSYTWYNRDCIGTINVPPNGFGHEFQKKRVSTLFVASLFANNETLAFLTSAFTSHLREELEELESCARFCGYFILNGVTYNASVLENAIQRILYAVDPVSVKLAERFRTGEHIKKVMSSVEDVAGCILIYNRLHSELSFEPVQVPHFPLFCRSKTMYPYLARTLLTATQQKMVRLMKEDKVAAAGYLDSDLFSEKHISLGIDPFFRNELKRIAGGLEEKREEKIGVEMKRP